MGDDRVLMRAPLADTADVVEGPLDQAEAGQRLQVRGRRRVTLEEAEAEAMQVLAACTVAWHLVGLDGKALRVPCDKDAALELYQTPGLRFITDQATDFAAAAGNYLPGSSTT